jgi:hypothetical protein
MTPAHYLLADALMSTPMAGGVTSVCGMSLIRETSFEERRLIDAFTVWLQDDIGLVQTGKAESLLESRLITGRIWAGLYWSMKILSKAF